MTTLRAITVEARGARVIRVRFSDETVKDIDLGPVLAGGGVFAPIRDDRAVFERVGVDPLTGAVGWPGGIDLDTEVLHGSQEPASGARIVRRDLASSHGVPENAG